MSSTTVTSLGEFELLVLLSVLRLDSKALALDIRKELENRGGRSVSRGALYSTLARLEEKGLLSWKLDVSIPARGGIPRRRFLVTPAGLEAVRASHRAISRLAEGLDAALEGR